MRSFSLREITIVGLGAGVEYMTHGCVGDVLTERQDHMQPKRKAKIMFSHFSREGLGNRLVEPVTGKASNCNWLFLEKRVAGNGH